MKEKREPVVFPEFILMLVRTVSEFLPLASSLLSQMGRFSTVLIESIYGNWKRLRHLLGCVQTHGARWSERLRVRARASSRLDRLSGPKGRSAMKNRGNTQNLSRPSRAKQAQGTRILSYFLRQCHDLAFTSSCIFLPLQLAKSLLQPCTAAPRGGQRGACCGGQLQQPPPSCWPPAPCPACGEELR